jgi:hypothetical protein
MVCLFSRFLSQCDIMDEEKYEKKSSLIRTAEESMPITRTVVKSSIPMLPSGTSKPESMIAGSQTSHSGFNFKKLPIPMLQSVSNGNFFNQNNNSFAKSHFDFDIKPHYYLNHHMDF